MEALLDGWGLDGASTVNLGAQAGRAVVGAVLVGLTLGCFYFMHFIWGVLRLEPGSREYYQQREHIMTESLVRYAITILCIFTIDALILCFFEWGARALLMGAAICVIVYAGKMVVGAISNRKVKNI